MMPFVGHSQTTDKVWIPRKDALKVKAAADSFKVAKVELAILKQDLSNTKAAIGQLQIALKASETADSLSQANLKLAVEREELLKNQIKLAESAAAQWEKAYRREKRKRVITGVVGVLTTASMFIINFKK